MCIELGKKNFLLSLWCFIFISGHFPGWEDLFIYTDQRFSSIVLGATWNPGMCNTMALQTQLFIVSFFYRTRNKWICRKKFVDFFLPVSFNQWIPTFIKWCVLSFNRKTIEEQIETVWGKRYIVIIVLNECGKQNMTAFSLVSCEKSMGHLEVNLNCFLCRLVLIEWRCPEDTRPRPRPSTDIWTWSKICTVTRCWSTYWGRRRGSTCSVKPMW